MLTLLLSQKNLKIYSTNQNAFTNFSPKSTKLQLSKGKGGKQTMNTRVRKGIFWSTVTASMVLAISFILNLAGSTAFAAGFHEHGRGMEMRSQHGFGQERMMGGFHHGVGFSWIGFLLFLIIGIAVLVLVVKWLRKKSASSSMQQFIDTSLAAAQKPLMNHNNASLLDEWEKNIANKKERL